MTVRRKRRILTPSIDTQDEYHALIATWMLRMLLGSGAAFRGFFDARRGFHDRDVSDFLGLQDVDENKVKVKELKGLMNELLSGFESIAYKKFKHSSLSNNINFMAERIKLSPLEKEFLAFAVLRERCEAFVDCLRLITRRSETQFVSLMATATSSDIEDVKISLARSSTLLESGMIKFQTNSRGSITFCVPDQMSQALMAYNDDVHALMCIFWCRPSQLRYAPEIIHMPEMISTFWRGC